MKTWATIKKILLAVCVITWLIWFIVCFPLLLTGGALYSMIGIAMLALSAIVPGILLWNYIKGNSNNSNKETTNEVP